MTDELRVGLITDVHYARMPPDSGRYYADSLVKLAAAVRLAGNAQFPDLVVCLGDLIDSPADGDAIGSAASLRRHSPNCRVWTVRCASSSATTTSGG